MPLYMLLAGLTPPDTWGGLTRGLTAASGPLRSGNPLRGRIAALLGPETRAPDPDHVLAELEAGRIEAYFQILRSYAPGGWRMKVRIEGLAHLDAALARGRGAILWVDHFVFNGLVPKRALAEAGYPFAHLSRPEHGFSKTEFGIRWLNPIRVRIEDRHLAERILIERGAETRAIRSAMRVLGGNGIVSITAGAWEGRKTLFARVMGHDLPLATGAASLSLATGAPLIPVSAVKDGPGAEFLLALGDPIRSPEGASRDEAARRICAEYGVRLEPWVRAYPGQWRGWTYLR